MPWQPCGDASIMEVTDGRTHADGSRRTDVLTSENSIVGETNNTDDRPTAAFLRSRLVSDRAVFAPSHILEQIENSFQLRSGKRQTLCAQFLFQARIAFLSYSHTYVRSGLRRIIRPTPTDRPQNKNIICHPTAAAATANLGASITNAR